MTARLPYALQKRGSALLDQQCWLWGHDVRRAAGNLLLELGFERHRPPEGQQGCTQYTRRSAGTELRVWGFGCYHCWQGSGVYLNRFAFVPQAATLHGAVWAAGDLPVQSAAMECAVVAVVARALAALESEAQQTAGLAYRKRCMGGWTKRAVPPADLVTAWLQLAGDVEAHAAQRRNPPAVAMQHSPCHGQGPVRVA